MWDEPDIYVSKINIVRLEAGVWFLDYEPYTEE